YDTSGPYSDAAAAIDVSAGLPAPRAAWVIAREDTESYVGRQIQLQDDGLLRQEQSLHHLSAGLQRQPRRAKSGAN
ncbi:phosphomethylpyrimidine synthase ThiC, partial [Roseateles sp. GG27B]